MKQGVKDIDIVINGTTKIRNKLSLDNDISRELDEILKIQQKHLISYKIALIKR